MPTGKLQGELFINLKADNVSVVVDALVHVDENGIEGLYHPL